MRLSRPALLLVVSLSGCDLSSLGGAPTGVSVKSPSPSKLTGVTAIAMGYHSVFATRVDGSVVAWGGNGKGNLA